MTDISIDKFLGGQVLAEQPLQGFRAGTDTVLLAASIPAQTNQRILELGAGSGIGLCCVGKRIEGVELIGVELDYASTNRANKNLARNALDGMVMQGDVFKMPDEIRQRQFHHVFVNPPYFGAHSHRAPTDPAKAAAHIDDMGIREWIKVARARVIPKGSLTCIQRASELPKILIAMAGLGDIRIQPVVSKANENAKSVIVQAWLDKHGVSKLLSPLVLYDDDGQASQTNQLIARDGRSTELGQT